MAENEYLTNESVHFELHGVPMNQIKGIGSGPPIRRKQKEELQQIESLQFGITNLSPCLADEE